MPEFHAPAASDLFFTETAIASVLGGAILGLSTVFKTGLTGEVLGVSGSSRAMLFKPGFDKAAFLLGVAGSGLVFANCYDGAFEPIPPPVTLPSDRRWKYMLRLFFGGMLVGIGTSFGNGCTSGHGLTGLARLSLRSWVGVPCFMGMGMVSATVFRGAEDIPADPLSERLAADWQKALAWFGGLVALLLLSSVVLVALRRNFGLDNQKLAPGVELVTGFCFGSGMGISGMVRASKVIGCLDLASGKWDPSLMFVMAGALSFTFPFFQIQELKGYNTPLLGGKFGLVPKSMPLDKWLIFGTTTFGFGWGLCGMCPGPIWANVGSCKSWEVLVAVGGMYVGMAIWVVWYKYGGGNKNCGKPAAKSEPAGGQVVAPMDDKVDGAGAPAATAPAEKQANEPPEPVKPQAKEEAGPATFRDEIPSGMQEFAKSWV